MTLRIGIGGVVVGIQTRDETFAKLIEERYADFLTEVEAADYEFEIDLIPQSEADGNPADDVKVWRNAQACGTTWKMTRGDFRAEWDPRTRRGRVRHTANPYSIDSVLRIVHTLVLAPRGGFLVHAASAIRNGKAFLFAGLSGAGKTTISRLAPPDATLLTDEISYVRRKGDGYVACGTPFAGELAKAGENVEAPLSALYFLVQGPENRIHPVASATEAARGLLANILFFAHDPELVETVFDSALEFVRAVPVNRLTFLPDERVWELIQ